jgi:hypothetical protein
MNTKSKYLVGLATAAALAVTLTACGGAASGADAPAASSSATKAPATKAKAPARPKPKAYAPAKTDATASIKQLSKQCFGEVGCQLTYKVLVKSNPASTPKSGTLTVYYTVKGDDSGPAEDNVEVDLSEGNAEGFESMASTASKNVKLTVKVTNVEYSKI